MLLLIDSMNTIKRVHGAAKKNDGISDDELTSRTISGSVGSFRRVLREIRPTHALAALEGGRMSWRNEIYPDYKKDRDEDSTVIVDASREIRSIMEKDFGLNFVRKEGHEADDVLGSMAITASKHNIPSILSSTDKDFASLLDLCPSLKLYDPFSSVYRDEAWVRKKFLVAPEYVVDSLALWGDKTDNVPGVPGIGVKKASDLINEYGHLENILANADKVKGKMGENLRKFADLARISLELVRLDRVIDVGISYRDLAVNTDAL